MWSVRASCSGGAGVYLGGMFREGDLCANLRGKKGNFVPDVEVDMLGVLLDLTNEAGAVEVEAAACIYFVNDFVNGRSVKDTFELRVAEYEVPATNLEDLTNHICATGLVSAAGDGTLCENLLLGGDVVHSLRLGGDVGTHEVAFGLIETLGRT